MRYLYHKKKKPLKSQNLRGVFRAKKNRPGGRLEYYLAAFSIIRIGNNKTRIKYIFSHPYHFVKFASPIEDWRKGVVLGVQNPNLQIVVMRIIIDDNTSCA